MDRVPQFFRLKLQRLLRRRKFAGPRLALDEQHPATISKDGEIRLTERPACPLGHTAVQRNPTALPAHIKNLLVKLRFTADVSRLTSDLRPLASNAD